MRNQVAPDSVQIIMPFGPNLVLSGYIFLVCVYNGMRDNNSIVKAIGKYGSNHSKVVHDSKIIVKIVEKIVII